MAVAPLAAAPCKGRAAAREQGWGRTHGGVPVRLPTLHDARGAATPDSGGGPARSPTATVGARKPRGPLGRLLSEPHDVRGVRRNDHARRLHVVPSCLGL